MNARQREKEIAARRALALRKLAKVFGTNGGDAGAGAYTAERQILVEILRTTNEPDVVALVRDRLAVIAEGGASTPSDSDDDTTAPPADVSEVKSRFSSAWTLKALRDIAKGTRPVPSALATGAFWEDLVAAGAPELAHLRATGGSRDDSLVGDDVTDTAAAPTREPLWRGLDVEARRIREKLRRDGYAQCPRPEAFEDDPSRLARDPWTDALGGDTTLDDLADAMDALRVAGWPPVAVYAFDATWTVIDRLFEFAEAAPAPATSRSNPAVSRGRFAPHPRSHRFESHRRSRATPRAPPTPWAPTFLFRTETIPRGTRGRRRPTIDAFAETTENRPSCASGFLSRTPRWTPDVCTYSPDTWIEPGTIRTTRTTSDPPRESREEAPRYDSPPRRAERFRRRRDRSARGRARPCTGADRVASARTTTPTRVKIRARMDSSRFDTREGYRTRRRRGARGARGRVEAWRARFEKRRRGVRVRRGAAADDAGGMRGVGRGGAREAHRAIARVVQSVVRPARVLTGGFGGWRGF